MNNSDSRDRLEWLFRCLLGGAVGMLIWFVQGIPKDLRDLRENQIVMLKTNFSRLDWNVEEAKTSARFGALENKTGMLERSHNSFKDRLDKLEGRK